MSVLIQIFLFLNFVFSNGQENINITRKPSSISLDYPDKFFLPPSVCGKSKGATECPLMGGRKIADCQCVCDLEDDRNVTYKSTFGFYGGEWKCENNTVVRKHADCLLLEEQSNYPIRTNSSSMLSLRNLKPRFNNSCNIERVLAGNSTYLNCDGKWAPLKGVNVSKSFNLTFNNTFLCVSQSLDPFLNGLVIRLAVECSEHYSMKCLLLKLQGHQICTLPPPTVATSKSKTTTPDPTSDSTFRIILIFGSLVIMAVLFIIVIVVDLTMKSRRRLRKRKRDVRRRDATTLSTQATENNYCEETLDVFEVNISQDEDGYTYPIHNTVPGGKDCKHNRRLSSKNRELTHNTARRGHMEKSSTVASLQDDIKSRGRSYTEPPRSKHKRKSSIEHLYDEPECTVSGGVSLYKDCKPSIRKNPSYPEHPKSRNKNGTSWEPEYYVLEGPMSYGARSSSERRRHNTLPNLNCAAMATNRENNDYSYNEVGEIIMRDSSAVERDYQQLNLDSRRSLHDHQALSFKERRKIESK